MTTPMDFVGIGDESTIASSSSKDDLTGSIKSDTSDTTLTDQPEDTVIRRTFTISSADKKPAARPVKKPYRYSIYLQIKQKMTLYLYISHSAPTQLKSPTLSKTIEETPSIREEGETAETKPRPPSIVPPQVEDLTRSGASSPALSTGYTLVM